MMKTTALNLLLIFLPWIIISCKPEAKEINRPNIILILTDDQGYGDLAAHGNLVLKTPNLDQFWSESIRLTDFHVSPTCAPTRAALMTGRNHNRVGVWHTVMGRSLLENNEITLAEVLSAQGYQTAIFGKWHLGDNYPFRPQDQGFQEVLIHGGGGVGQIPDYWGNDYFDDTYFLNGVPEQQHGYCTDVWFDAAENFLERQAPDKPFFIYLATNAPHGPYRVPESYAAAYRGQPGVVNPEFNGMITHLDERFGKMERKLEDLGLKDNTILIFMTDNGTAAGFDPGSGEGFNAGMRGKKGSQFEGGHRVPFMIRWPDGKLTGGKDLGLLTAHVDVLPTLAEACGLKLPDDLKLDGTSLWKALRQDKDVGDRILITDSQRQEEPEQWKASAVMKGKWRLIDGKSLYQVQEDPGQQKDLAEKYPEIVQELRTAYLDYWNQISPSFKDFPRIEVKRSAVPVVLTSHDWHNVEKPGQNKGENNPPWNQPEVISGVTSNGTWTLDFKDTGIYLFELRRWPPESGLGLREVPENTELWEDTGKAPEVKSMNITNARLLLGEQEKAATIVAADAECITLELEVPAGPANLKTFFELEDGTTLGAYYVTIRSKS